MVVILLLSGVARAFVYTDPTEFYSTRIEDSWVFQAHHSTPQLTVFYGEGDWELLYFERLGPVSDASSVELTERSLELYAGPGGLEDFKLERALSSVDVAGQSGTLCAYSYQDDQGNRIWESRIFIVLANGEGFSIALSDREQWVIEDSPLLGDILSHWRWLF